MYFVVALHLLPAPTKHIDVSACCVRFIQCNSFFNTFEIFYRLNYIVVFQSTFDYHPPNCLTSLQHKATNSHKNDKKKFQTALFLSRTHAHHEHCCRWSCYSETTTTINPCWSYNASFIPEKGSCRFSLIHVNCRTSDDVYVCAQLTLRQECVQVDVGVGSETWWEIKRDEIKVGPAARKCFQPRQTKCDPFLTFLFFISKLCALKKCGASRTTTASNVGSDWQNRDRWHPSHTLAHIKRQRERERDRWARSAWEELAKQNLFRLSFRLHNIRSNDRIRLSSSIWLRLYLWQ